MDKKYILPEDNAPQMASEPVAAYAIPQEQTVMDSHIANVFETKRADEFAKKVCFTEEAYKYHKKHSFYASELPVQESISSEEQLVEILDAADAEGYITDEETNHLMNLWQLAV